MAPSFSLSGAALGGADPAAVGPELAQASSEYFRIFKAGGFGHQAHSGAIERSVRRPVDSFGSKLLSIVYSNRLGQ